MPVALQCSFLGHGIYLNASSRFYWPDHISLQTLEKMCLALVERQGDETTLNHYRIAVYTKAAFLVARLPRAQLGERLHLQDLLRSSKKKYEATALAELAKVNLLAAPSLSLLQALLSGVRLSESSGVKYHPGH